MREEWVLAVRDECGKRGVPFFFKQWGGVQKGKHGRLLDGRTHDGFPRQVPARTRRSRSATPVVAGLQR